MFLSQHQSTQSWPGHVAVTLSDIVMTRSRCCHTIRHSHDQVTLLSYYHSHDQVTLLSHHQTTQSGPGHVVVTLSDTVMIRSRCCHTITVMTRSHCCHTIRQHSQDQVTLLSHHQTTQSGPGHVAVTLSDNTVRTRTRSYHTNHHSHITDTVSQHSLNSARKLCELRSGSLLV